MSNVKRFRKCADPCQRYLTPDDAHDLCVMCLGEEHTRSVLEGTECVHCERFSLRKSALVCPFSRGNWDNNLPPRGSGPATAEAARRLRSWGSQRELADQFERGVNLEGELLEEDVLSLTSSDPAGSALQASSQGEQDLADEGEDDVSEPSQPACPAYGELMEVMDRATARLEIARGRFDE